MEREFNSRFLVIKRTDNARIKSRIVASHRCICVALLHLIVASVLRCCFSSLHLCCVVASHRCISSVHLVAPADGLCASIIALHHNGPNACTFTLAISHQGGTTPLRPHWKSCVPKRCTLTRPHRITQR